MRVSLVALSAGLLLLAFGAFGPAVAVEENESDLVSIEKTLWKAWQDHDSEPFDRYLADGIVDITPAGILSGKGEVVESSAGGSCDVRSYSLSDFKSHQVAPEVVLLTYAADQDATCDGVKSPSRVLASTVFVLRKGRWLVVSHQESPSRGH